MSLKFPSSKIEFSIVSCSIFCALSDGANHLSFGEIMAELLNFEHVNPQKCGFEKMAFKVH